MVVGAHLRAEALDRPVGAWLRDRLESWVMARNLAGEAPRVLVCTDVWYLNSPALAGVHAVSVGGPAVNALTAHWASRVPAAVAVEGEMVVQFDADSPWRAACWGADARGTAAAVEAFVQRYGDEFMEAATRGWPAG